MKSTTILSILLFLAALAGFGQLATPSPKAGIPQDALMPNKLLFMENRGQVLDQYGHSQPEILFLGKGDGIKIAISNTGISYQFERMLEIEGPTAQLDAHASVDFPGHELPKPFEVETYRLDMHLVGANPNPVVRRDVRNPYFENYYNILAAPEGILGVKAYEKITLQGVYPGIDWVIYSQGTSMKYDFLVHPGADPAQIKMKYEGSEELLAYADGSLTITTPLGEIMEQAPVTYCGNKEVPSRFAIDAQGNLSFDIANYDTSLALLIDPYLIWGTYYGGALQDNGYATIVDTAGNVYLAGRAVSTTNIASGGHQNTYGGGNSDASLTKFTSAGVRVWATYYGGPGEDRGLCTAVDPQGRVYLGGFTGSDTLISFNGHQNTPTYNFGVSEAFLVKFDSAGVRIWATYYGGWSNEIGRGIACDGSGNVYLAGDTGSPNNIAFGGYLNVYAGGVDGFLVKFNALGVRLWGTYYGGNSGDGFSSIDVDAAGNVFLAGTTISTSGIASGGHQNSYGGGYYDGFLVKFTPAGARVWGTYYGGTLHDFGNATAVDPAGNVFLAGFSRSSANIAYNAYQGTLNGDSDAYLVKFSTTGVRLWGTYCGGPDAEQGLGVAIDNAGTIYMTGETRSTTNFASGGYQNTFGGGFNDAFLAQFAPSGVRNWATYIGGTNQDWGESVCTFGNSAIYVAGYTISPNGIASNGHQNTFAGDTEYFLVKIGAVNNAPVAICQNLTVNANGNCQGTAIAAQFNNGSTDPENDPLSFAINPGGSFPIGPTNLVFSVSDGQGNTSTCNATITVLAPAPALSVAAASATCGYNVSCAGGSDGTATATVTGGCPGFTYLWSNGQTSATATGLGAGSYSVTVSDGAGGSVVQTVTLTAPSALQASALVSGTCMGAMEGSIDLQVTGGNDCHPYSFHWSNGAVTEDLTVLPAGTYTVTVTDAGGCTTTNNITISAFPNPSPAFTQAGNVLTSTLTWSSYQWLLNGNNISGANASSYTATQSGIYTLSVIDSNGCSGISNPIAIEIVGIANAMGDWADLSIYPNPARGEFRLRTASPIGYGITVSVTDMYGKRYLDRALPELGHEIAFDIRAYAAGTYTVEVTSEAGQRKVFRLIVQ